MSELLEQKPEFYDSQYFEAMRLRHTSGAHSSRINNILSTIGDVQKKQLLDIGCGDGWITNKLAERGANIIGIDHSESAVNFARNQYPKDNFKVCSIYNIEQFQNETFDGVLLIDILGHVQDLEKVFSQIKTILKPNGFIVASEDVYSSPWHKFPLSAIIKKSLILSKDGRSYLAIKKSERSSNNVNYHVSQINDFSEKQFKNLFEENSFKVIKHNIYPLVAVPIRDFFLKIVPHSFHGDHQCLKAIKI